MIDYINHLISLNLQFDAKFARGNPALQQKLYEQRRALEKWKRAENMNSAERWKKWKRAETKKSLG